MTDREVADLVNSLTKIAREYGHTEQCRDRIAEVIVPLSRKGQRMGEVLGDKWRVTRHALPVETLDWQ